MKRKTTEEFIEEASKIHGDKYDYSNVEYINSYTKVRITCKKHGDFWQTPNSHLKGYGCNKCSYEHSVRKPPFTTEQFIEKARKIHGNKYDYSKVVYINNHTKVCIICPVHGEFWQIPETHLQGGGCRKCGIIVAAEKLSGEKEFFKKAKEKYGDKFDYSNVNYVNAFTNVEIICNKHGRFLTSPHEHLRGNGGCLECKKEKIGNFFRSNTERFIEKARQVHGDKYDYSEVVYKKSTRKSVYNLPKARNV